MSLPEGGGVWWDVRSVFFRRVAEWRVGHRQQELQARRAWTTLDTSLRDVYRRLYFVGVEDWERVFCGLQ
eukprot:551684-Rhodomonas_salina.1